MQQEYEDPVLNATTSLMLYFGMLSQACEVPRELALPKTWRYLESIQSFVEHWNRPFLPVSMKISLSMGTH